MHILDLEEVEKNPILLSRPSVTLVLLPEDQLSHIVFQERNGRGVTACNKVFSTKILGGYGLGLIRRSSKSFCELSSRCRVCATKLASYDSGGPLQLLHCGFCNPS